MELAQRLAEARKARGMSQAEAAEQLGVSRQAISRWETGAGIPTLDNLMQLGTLYQVSLDALVYGAGPSEPEEAHAAPETETQTEGPKMAREPKRKRSALLGTGLALVAVGILALGIWAGGLLAAAKSEEEIVPWADLQTEQTIEITKEVEFIPWE